MAMDIPRNVGIAFGLIGDGVLLPGGQGQTVRFGPVVVKPCGDTEEAAGLAELLAGIGEEGFRIAPPVQAVDGRWVVDGWQAFKFIEGKPGWLGREAQAVAACRAFHESLRRAWPHDYPPGWLTHRRDFWQLADRVAWGEVDPAEVIPQGTVRAIEPWLNRLRPIDDLRPQVTHGDPGGDNILFAEGLPLAIIDMPPYWRPAGYATAMMLADSVAWEGSSPGVLAFGADEPHFPQLLLRAALFRLVVAAVVHGGLSAVEKRIEAYAAALDWQE